MIFFFKASKQMTSGGFAQQNISFVCRFLLCLGVGPGKHYPGAGVCLSVCPPASTSPGRPGGASDDAAGIGIEASLGSCSLGHVTPLPIRRRVLGRSRDRSDGHLLRLPRRRAASVSAFSDCDKRLLNLPVGWSRSLVRRLLYPVKPGRPAVTSRSRMYML